MSGFYYVGSEGITLTRSFSNYKLDFDIAGMRNSLMAISLENEIVQQPWFEDDWGQDVRQQKIVRKFVTNESDALLDYPKNYEGVYVIVNQEELNRWGYRRSAFVVTLRSQAVQLVDTQSILGCRQSIWCAFCLCILLSRALLTCRQTNLDSKRTENNVNFAKHHLAISRRKDSEPSSSTTWNLNLPGAPRRCQLLI